jgi:predicted GNAT family N-acyltransferase
MTTEYEIELVDEYWLGFGKLRKLTYELLYRDFGVPEDADWYHGDVPSIHAIARYQGRLLGAARLLGSTGDAQRQLRQVLVIDEMRRRGIGAALVEDLERLAAGEGASVVWLNARDTAFSFYERLGYTYDGELFVSEATGIPHRRMLKQVTGIAG